ncbi:MAG: hypothetical protein DWQ35_04425 [Planctomycetota bacterium]|nr:MAG: hypothetical protein DWQ35_04425 [Planctomycetota bacterium]REK25089.1 MAG: hypothetical protein DWQ42_12015 [Planctomycetota bacterium]REK44657.1 MAG: hypothetical protein DWQ46_08780 [Planctomycetota bacterium]
MVGHRNPEALLQCNTYVRTLDTNRSSYHVCVDPGSRLDFPVVEANIGELVGDISEIDRFTVNHQDPDVTGNCPFFCLANPKIKMIATEETWRLLQHLRFTPGRIHLANVAAKTRFSIAAGHDWQVVPTPFCHFRGAMAFYDPEIRTLFSGDLFGGFNRLGGVHLIATEEDWSGIAQFHEIYMPTREVLRYAVQQIRQLRPTVETIAPQHGHVITGDLVSIFLERMYDLRVGHDLLADTHDEEKLAGYQEVLAQIVERAELSLGRAEVLRRLKNTNIDDDLAQFIAFEGQTIVLLRDGYRAVTRVTSRLGHGERLQFVVGLRSVVLSACTERDLPIPPVGAGIEAEATGNME